MKLTPTGMVILGFLSECEMSGYDIKAEVDVSTRFFWAASYGQIYPELKGLSEAGLVEGVDQSQGSRPRTVYRITPAGLEALRSWLRRTPETMELRHEGLLKVFFADALPRRERVEMLQAMADQHREKRGQLAAVEREVHELPAEGDPSWSLVLRFGLEFNQWVVEWCERTIAELEAKTNEGDDDV